MDDSGILGGTLGQLGQATKQAVKQVVKLPEEMAEDTRVQLGGLKPDENVKKEKQKKQWASNDERISFLKQLYGAKDKPSEFQEQIKDEKPEDQKKLVELRNQLHQDYVRNAFEPPKKQEERPAEKVENEKKKEMQDLQQKEAKAPPPLAVVREQNKTEMFRGASG